MSSHPVRARVRGDARSARRPRDTGALPATTAAGGWLQRGTCQDPYGPEGDLSPGPLSEGSVLLAGDMRPVTRGVGCLQTPLPHFHSLSAPGLEAQS